MHTAVKIAPHYDHPVIHVNDASRSVPVVSSLLSEDGKAPLVASVNKEYEQLRELNKNAHSQNKFLSIAEARRNKLSIDWKTSVLTKPTFTGNKQFTDFDLNRIVPYIDWTPFFHSWEMKGSYPKILSDAERGVEATKLFNDAQDMLKKIISEKWLRANAVVGMYPANSVGDDIEVYTDETRTVVKTKLHTLRQQSKKPGAQPNLALADFIAPKETGCADYIGGFAVTAGIGIDIKVAEFERNHDDYSSIMLKAIADRLAEAFAELMHELVRREYWGYAKNETLTNEQRIKEEYVGIRPAQGYPACPDHTEKRLQFDLFEVELNTGIVLTESYAMLPTAAVSGLYFSHPQSQYFGLGKITKDQVEEYSRRKNLSLEETERWLSPNLAY